MTSLPNPADERWAVILVHGVGETKPADMIDAVAPILSAVQDPTHEPADGLDVMQLPDEDGKTFPVFMRRDQIGAAAVLFAEVFWADLSRIRRGSLALLAGIYYLVFSVRYIADQGSAQPGMAPALLRALLRTAAYLLRGPMFALYTIATLYAIISLAAEGLRRFGWPIDVHGAPIAPAVFGALGLAAVVAGLAAAWRTWRTPYFTSPPWIVLALVGAAAVALSVLALTRPDAPPLRWLPEAVRREYSTIGGVGEAEFYAAAATLAANWVLRIIAGVMLAALLPLGWAWLLGRLRQRQALAGAYLAGALQTLLWALVVLPLDGVVVWAVTVRQPPDQSQHYWDGLYRHFALQSAAILILIVVAGVVLGARGVWSLRHSPAGWPAQQAPRLIVAAPMALALFTVAVMFFVFRAVIPFYGPMDIPLPHVFNAYVLWIVAVAFVAAAHLLVPKLRNVLHVVMDVINHFRTKQGHFPVRERIAHRFRSVLQYVLAGDPPTHLLVIAHSQGTVITIDALLHPDCQDAMRRAGLRPENTRLATFGSPYTHLYQFYFPAQYPPQPGDVILGPAFGRWVNLFHIDDYVGTQVAGRPDADRPTNVALPAEWLMAHTDYWRDDVFRRITDLLPGAPAPPPGA